MTKNETTVTVQGKSGRKYSVKTHQYGDYNVEIILVFAGLVVASGVRPLRGKGCDEGLDNIIKRAEEYTIANKINNGLTYHD